MCGTPQRSRSTSTGSFEPRQLDLAVELGQHALGTSQERFGSLSSLGDG